MMKIYESLDHGPEQNIGQFMFSRAWVNKTSIVAALQTHITKFFLGEAIKLFDLVLIK